MKEPSGKKPRVPLPDFKFPGESLLPAISAIGDASVGRRKWTDAEVIYERNILLGPNDAATWRIVEDARARQLLGLDLAFAATKRLERIAFGEQSYFRSSLPDANFPDVTLAEGIP